CTLGPIIHNPQVLKEYENKGVVVLEDADQARPEDRVVIRAHGIPRHKEEALNRIGAEVVDATCPKVKKAQQAIATLSRDNHLLLFGEPDHPEVKGLISHARQQWTIIEEENSLDPARINPEQNYLLTAQTTQDKSQFQALQGRLFSVLGNNLRVADTICEATRNRQMEAIDIARRVEFMIVIGGRISGNTRRLVQVVRDQKVACTHVESAAELDLQDLENYRSIGVTAGASTPGVIIREVIRAIERSRSAHGADQYPAGIRH
ncbi:MAG: 4-hydroxy-3-methylbut-2-enyl diphosphate reductase, partial [Desulfonatronovibrionaceae bacterium]